MISELYDGDLVNKLVADDKDDYSGEEV